MTHTQLIAELRKSTRTARRAKAERQPYAHLSKAELAKRLVELESRVERAAGRVSVLGRDLRRHLSEDRAAMRDFGDRAYAVRDLLLGDVP